MFFMKLWWSLLVLAIGWNALLVHMCLNAYSDRPPDWSVMLIYGLPPLVIVFWLRWLFAPSIQRLSEPVGKHSHSSPVW